MSHRSTTPKQFDGIQERQQIVEINDINDKLPLYSLIKADANKYGKFRIALRSVGFYVALSYRISHYLHKKKWEWLAIPLQFLTACLTFCNINRKAIIGPGLALPHPTSIFIGPHASIGKDSRLGPRVFIGSKYNADDSSDYPVISSGVTIGVGATIMGGITIGEGVMIAPNELVMKDIPDFHNVMSTPPRSFLRTVDEWKK